MNWDHAPQNWNETIKKLGFIFINFLGVFKFFEIKRDSENLSHADMFLLQRILFSYLPYVVVFFALAFVLSDEPTAVINVKDSIN